MHSRKRQWESIIYFSRYHAARYGKDSLPPEDGPQQRCVRGRQTFLKGLSTISTFRKILPSRRSRRIVLGNRPIRWDKPQSCRIFSQLYKR
jgi:hypothetical protein